MVGRQLVELPEPTDRFGVDAVLQDVAAMLDQAGDVQDLHHFDMAESRPKKLSQGDLKVSTSTNAAIRIIEQFEIESFVYTHRNLTRGISNNFQGDINCKS